MWLRELLADWGALRGWHAFFVAMAGLAGAVHVLSPDHWLPASVLSWQRGWGVRKTTRFAFAVLLGHVVLGALIFFVANPFIRHLGANVQMGIGLAWVALGLLFRMLRFSRIGEVLRGGPRSRWGMLTVMTLLGPCESIFPVLVKAGLLGIGYPAAIAAYLGGTLLVGGAFVVGARLLWDRPLWLPRGVSWAYRPVSIFPVGAGMALGLAVITVLS